MVRTGGIGTRIYSYRLTAGNVTARCKLGLLNVLGQELASWRVSLHAGEQNLLLPLEQTKLTAGVYFIRAEWRAQTIVRKWTVVR